MHRNRNANLYYTFFGLIVYSTPMKHENNTKNIAIYNDTIADKIIKGFPKQLQVRPIWTCHLHAYTIAWLIKIMEFFFLVIPTKLI